MRLWLQSYGHEDIMRMHEWLVSYKHTPQFIQNYISYYHTNKHHSIKILLYLILYIVNTSSSQIICQTYFLWRIIIFIIKRGYITLALQNMWYNETTIKTGTMKWLKRQIIITISWYIRLLIEQNLKGYA